MMGFDAHQVDAMSIWQFNAQMLGWSKQFETSSGMSDDERDELWEFLQKKDVPLSHKRRPH